MANVFIPKKTNTSLQLCKDEKSVVPAKAPLPEDRKEVRKEDDPQKGLLGLSTGFVRVPQGLDKTISALVSDPDAESVLRQAIVAERSRGHESKLSHYKHFYVTGSGTVTTSEQSVQLFTAVQGSGINNRLTNRVKLHRITCRIRFVRAYSATATTAYFPPTVSIIIGRTKVPASIGVVLSPIWNPTSNPPVSGTGANPPVSSTSIYDSAGATGATGNIPSTMVRNVNTADMYHIYYDKHLIYNQTSMGLAGTGIGQVVPEVHLHTFQIDLHGLDQMFISSGNNGTVINQLWFAFRGDTDYTGLGFTDSLYYSFDTEFRDVQD